MEETDTKAAPSWETLRGYAQAVSDLSGIARARLLDVAREAVRGELEKAGAAVGLATAEETAVLRRTVERLERRVALLEHPGAAPHADHAARGGEHSPRPVRRPSAARSRTGAPRTAGPPASPSTPTGAPAPGAADASSPTPTPPGTAAAAPRRRAARRPAAETAPVTAPEAGPPTTPASAARARPVRRPRPVVEASEAASATGAGAAGGTDEGSAL